MPALHGGSSREGTPRSGPHGAWPASLSPFWSPQPVPNHNPWMLLYFISFLLIVSFFVLNMFVGVVVENFHKCRQHQEAEEARRREEKRLRRLEKKRRSEWVTCGGGGRPPGPRAPLPAALRRPGPDPSHWASGPRGNRGLCAPGLALPQHLPDLTSVISVHPESDGDPTACPNEARQLSPGREQTETEPGCPALSCGTPILPPAGPEPLNGHTWGG